MSQCAVPVSSAQCSVGRFCFYRKLARMFPPPSTDHGLISSNIKEGGNIDVQNRNAFTYQVSSVSRGTVTLSSDVITPSSIVTFTFEVTALTIGARWTGVGTNSSLKCQHFSKAPIRNIRKDERECHVASLTLLTQEAGENSGRKQQNTDNESMIDV